MTRGPKILLEKVWGLWSEASRLLALCALAIAFGAVGLTGCLSDADQPENEPLDELISDGDYTPVVPTLPPGWPALQWPVDNPFSPAKAILGRRLFFEVNLSRNGLVSCTWCHDPGYAFTDFHRSAFSTGIGGVSATRNTPTLINLAFAKSFMFDGEVATLEDQAEMPLLNPHEMDMTASEIESRLAEDTMYVRLFREAFGSGPITLRRVAFALATFQRSLVSYRSPYDRWVAGDTGALTESARRGAAIFLGEKGGCARCHIPPLFTDGKFHDNGLDSLPVDSGRFHVTKTLSDYGKFKTPTLRNIFKTEPYMHDGRFATVEDIVRHYNTGLQPSANTDTLLKPLGLSEFEIIDLVSFLESLTDEYAMRTPRL